MALLYVACINVNYLPEYSIKGKQYLEVVCENFGRSWMVLSLVAAAMRSDAFLRVTELARGCSQGLGGI